VNKKEMTQKRGRFSKKELERRNRELKKQESKARAESEDRQERIRVLWDAIMSGELARDAKDLAENELVRSLIELVGLQKHKIEYLGPFWQLVQKISKRFPSEWRNLSEANALAELKEICAEFEKLFPGVLPAHSKLLAKQKSEAKRRRQFAAGGVGLIEWEFGGAREQLCQTDPLLRLTPALLLTSPTCFDNILAGDPVRMERLETLFWIHRNRLAKLVSHEDKKCHEYDYRAIVKIMDALLSEERKSRGRPLQTWPSNPKVRTRVLSGIEARIKSFSTTEQIKAEFLAVIRRHLPDSAKK
jgi:hypothetical protein